MKRTIALSILTLLFAAISVRARTYDVYPTGTTTDLQNVSAMLLRAQPGDTILLHAHTDPTLPAPSVFMPFDWSGNNVPISPLLGPFGIPVMRSNITIEGEKVGASGNPLTLIRGPQDTDQFPRVEIDPRAGALTDQLCGQPTTGGYANAAFFIGPRVTNVRIQNLQFENFEVVLGMLQTRDQNIADIYVLGGDFSQGADGVVFENNYIRNSFSGIQGVGGNGFVARNNLIVTVWKRGASPVALLPMFVGIGNSVFVNNQTNSDAPGDNGSPAITIEGNFISGPNGPFDQPTDLLNIQAAIRVIGSFNTKITRNQIDGYPNGIVLAGQGDSAVIENRVYPVMNGIVVADSSVTSAVSCPSPSPRPLSGIPGSNTENATIRGNTVGNIPPRFGIGVEGDCNLIISNNVGTPSGGPGIGYNDRAENNLFIGNNSAAISGSPASPGNNYNVPLGDITQAAAPGTCTAVVDFGTVGTPGNRPNCWTLANDAPAGNVFPAGRTVVTWTLHSHGRSSIFRQNVTVTAVNCHRRLPGRKHE